MTFRVRFTRAAEDDLLRLYRFILDRDPTDWALAEQVLESIRHGIEALGRSPFAYRKAAGSVSPFLRELVIPFGSSGYVALFEIESDEVVTVLAVRHQREDDFY